jgi:hypothetical protein
MMIEGRGVVKRNHRLTFCSRSNNKDSFRRHVRVNVPFAEGLTRFLQCFYFLNGLRTAEDHWWVRGPHFEKHWTPVVRGPQFEEHWTSVKMCVNGDSED